MRGVELCEIWRERERARVLIWVMVLTCDRGREGGREREGECLVIGRC